MMTEDLFRKLEILTYENMFGNNRSAFVRHLIEQAWLKREAKQQSQHPEIIGVEDMEFVDWKFTCKVCGQKTARMVYPPEGILRWSNNKVFCPICGVWTKPLDHELERHINETTPFSLDHFRGTK